jgi:hypothetical protein
VSGLSNPPRVAVWPSVPDDCWMRGELEVGDHHAPNIHIILGSDGDDTNLIFEREAPQIVLDSRYGLNIRERSRSTTA